MTKNTLVEKEKPSRIRDYVQCPYCGRKGLYHIKLNFYQCRYCKFYRFLTTQKTR